MNIKYITRFVYTLFLFTLLSPPALIAQEDEMETIFTEDVLVTAVRGTMLAPDVPRGIIILSADDISRAPVQNLQELLSYYSGLDIKKRGPEGVQADVSIRGGTFEQTLILLNGIRISDPQTAHNNLNIPVNLGDIEKIEILKGQASGLFGANALSGVINIITKKGKKQELSAAASGGDFGYYNAGASLMLPFGSLFSRLGFAAEHSNGYRYNTGFDKYTLSYNSSLFFNSGSAEIFAGYTDREFGANGFYSDRYPNQWERIKTLFLSASGSLRIGDIEINPKFYLRNNRDNYLLDFARPGFYNNLHKTNSYGSELQMSYKTGAGTVIAGAEFGFDDINSNNLGIHERGKGGISAGFVFSGIRNLKVIASGFAYNYADFGWKFWPGIDAGYHISDALNIFASAGKSFRLPSFTEMYYSSPIQKGTASLQPEEAGSYEAGIKSPGGSISYNAAVFYRSGSNFIDWIRNTPDQPWVSANVAEIKTRGLEAGVTLSRQIFGSLPVQHFRINYTYIDAALSKPQNQSRYILDHLRHQLNLMLSHNLPLELLMSWELRFESRFSQNEYFIADAKISRSIADFELYLQASNLFDRNYTGTGGIPMPGRWLIGGIRFTKSDLF